MHVQKQDVSGPDGLRECHGQSHWGYGESQGRCSRENTNLNEHLTWHIIHARHTRMHRIHIHMQTQAHTHTYKPLGDVAEGKGDRGGA
ncbi:hypothetical protein EON63_06785 [archaeon]|nr:MAG: hypothetical protein EON63_06785 [archaeon]